MSFVVIGRDIGAKNPSLAIGPFITITAADEFQDRLTRTSQGVHVVLPLHTPTRETEPRAHRDSRGRCPYCGVDA